MQIWCCSKKNDLAFNRNRCRAEMESKEQTKGHTESKENSMHESLRDYRGEVILVGINYESKELREGRL